VDWQRLSHSAKVTGWILSIPRKENRINQIERKFGLHSWPTIKGQVSDKALGSAADGASPSVGFEQKREPRGSPCGYGTSRSPFFIGLLKVAELQIIDSSSYLDKISH
jgi:hypothetical protein